MAAEGVTFPIDITKTRLQLQGQADFTGTKFGFGGMVANIMKTEGIGGLYAGCTPAVARHVPYTGFRAIGYEYIRAFFCGDKPKDQAPLLAKMAAGMTAGGVGQAIAVPCDLIKVRMQGDGRLVAAGKLSAPRYAGLFDAFAKIKAAEGMGGARLSRPCVRACAPVRLPLSQTHGGLALSRARAHTQAWRRRPQAPLKSHTHTHPTLPPRTSLLRARRLLRRLLARDPARGARESG